MAAHVSLTPRPMTSGSVPRMHLPVIEHPMSRMGDHAGLSVSGEMTRLGLSAREQTFVTLGDDGRLHMGLDRSGFPPLGARTNSACSMLFFQHPGDHAVRNLSDKGKYRRPVENTPRMGPDELEYMLGDKFTMEPHGLKHLFKTNDPNGQGAVTREGLLKICYSLFGYISNDHFNRLLKRIGLDNAAQITYEDVSNYFTCGESKPRAWVSPINHQVDIQTKHTEAHLRVSPDHMTRNKVVSSSTCHMLLKERIKQKIEMSGSSMNILLPTSCQEPFSIILPDQLLDLLSQLSISIKQQDFYKLWQRYDKEGVGAVKKLHLFGLLGLDNVGFLPVTSTKDVIINSRSNTAGDKPLKESSSPRKQMRGESRDSGRSESRDSGRSDTRMSLDSKKANDIKQVTRKKTAPTMETVTEMLHYKFEEPYNSMRAGMQCFDFLGDGVITKIDLKRVFDEFDMEMLAMNIDTFLTRIGCKVQRNQVPYRDLLDKFWNRSESGLVHRIVNTNQHFFLSDGYHGYSNHMTPEQLEARLVEFFHKDYYSMIQHIKAVDRYKLGVVTQHELRAGIQKALGYTITSRQWDQLINTIGLDSDGLVPYTTFLQQFNTPKPGQWKKGFSQSQRRSTRSAEDRLHDRCVEEAIARQPQLDRLREDTSESISLELKHRVARNIQSLHDEKHGRSLNELNVLVRELMQQRFATVDNVFKSMDPKMTGRLNKPQFVKMLNQCDLEILALEGDRLWGSYDVASDGMMTFTNIVQNYRDFSKPKLQSQQPGEHRTELDKSTEFHGKYGYAYHNVACDESIIMPRNSPVEELEELRPNEENRKRSVKTSDQSASSYSKTGRLTDIMDKVKPQIHDNWSQMQQILLQADSHGEGVILGMDMKDIMKTLRLPLNDSELRSVLGAYDKNKDGRFHYLDFLSRCANSSDPESNKCDELLTDFRQLLQQKAGREGSTYMEVVDRIRSDLNKPPLLREHRSIRRAFRKADTDGDGVLSIAEFKQLLRSCGMNIRVEDLYHIISEFDVNMDGKISYSQFLNQVLLSR